MYKLSDDVIELFKKNYRQIVSITFRGLDETIELTETDILEGGLSLDRYCTSGSKVEIGSAISAELTLDLDNRDGKFDDVRFEGAELFVQIGIKKWDAMAWEKAVIHWIPVGYFTVDETPRKLSTINLTALDRMVQFDKEIDRNRLFEGMNVKDLISICCEACNVPLSMDLYDTVGKFLDVIVSEIPTPSNEYTYRQIIQWIAELSGTCAYIDWDGNLCFGWYNDLNFELEPSNRYTSDLYENDITITGVQVSDDDDNVYIAGTTDYAFNIEGNYLIVGKEQEIANMLGDKLIGFTYRPYSCTFKSAPFLYPLDSVVFIDKKGVKHKSIITHLNYKINRSTEISGKGETSTKNGYAFLNPLTKQEAIIMDKIKNEFNKDLTSQEQNTLRMNEIISNSFGLYITTIKQPDGTNAYYYHDKEKLEDSKIIYTFNSGGFAWTNDWNKGNPVWKYGFTKEGNAVFNILSTYKISAEYIDTSNLKVSADNVTGLNVYVKRDENDQVVSMLNASVNVVTLKSNRLSIDSDNFKLTTDGKITATGGTIGGFEIGKTSLWSGISSMTTTNKDGVYIGHDGINLGGNFIVTQTGDVSMTKGSISLGKSDSGWDYFVKVTNSGFSQVSSSYGISRDVRMELNYYGLTFKNYWQDYNEDNYMFIGTQGDIYGYGSPSYNIIKAYPFIHIVAQDNENDFSYTSVAYIDMNSSNSKNQSVLDIFAINTTLTATTGKLSGTWTGTSGSAVTSDKTLKHDIKDLEDAYSNFFDKLKPIKYKYNDGTSNRFHTGFIAQDVELAIKEAGLSTDDFAGYILIHDFDDKDKEITYLALRYSEFIALCVNEIQKLKTRVSGLEKGGTTA